MANHFHTEAYLDDITFIGDMKHISASPWHQYDVLLAARGYGWDLMLDWADYMRRADLEHISQVTVAAMGERETDLTEEFRRHGSFLKAPSLTHECGMLSAAGFSKVLGAPVKIVWFNQTRVLRFFTTLDDDSLMQCYIETVIRRSFGTANAMKRGNPIPQA